MCGGGLCHFAAKQHTYLLLNVTFFSNLIQALSTHFTTIIVHVPYCLLALLILLLHTERKTCGIL